MAIEKISAIRGATTAEENSAAAIRESTEELVRIMIAENKIDKSARSAVSCIVSTSADITALYPARVIRESGLLDCPMFSCLEPDMDGALPFCIRIMLTVSDTKKACADIKHVYLHEAKRLRPDLSKPFAVAIDGPSGAGKSTVAKLLSKAHNMTYLDTGAMYRAIGLKMHNCGVALDDTRKIEHTLENTDITVTSKDGVQHVLLDGQDVSEEIRKHFVSKLASDFSAVKQVRLKLVEMQRKIASGKDCILDGRDIGTYVLPDAAVKIYLTAGVKVRARRRFDELTAKGEKCELDKIEKDIESRDYNDMHRDFAPLRKAEDAVEVVTDNMDIEEVVRRIGEIIENKRSNAK